MISPALFFLVIIHTIAALQTFDQVYTAFFNPQLDRSARTPSLFYMIYLFQQAFQFFHMGYASAIAWLLFLIIMVVTVVQITAAAASSTTRADADERRSEPRRAHAGAPDPALPPVVVEPAADGGRGRSATPARQALFLVLLAVFTILFLYPFVWLDQRVAEAAGDVVRQQADPAGHSSRGTTSTCSVACRTAASRRSPLVLQQLLHRRRSPRSRSRSRARSSRSRSRTSASRCRNFLFGLRARDDDAARRGDDDPGLPDLAPPVGTCAEHAVPALGRRTSSAARSTSSCSASSSSASRASSSRRRAWTATATSRCSGASRCRSRSRR